MRLVAAMLNHRDREYLQLHRKFFGWCCGRAAALGAQVQSVLGQPQLHVPVLHTWNVVADPLSSLLPLNPRRIALILGTARDTLWQQKQQQLKDPLFLKT